jgi:hypothetical protein
MTKTKLTSIGIYQETKKQLEIISKQNCDLSMNKTIMLLLTTYNSINFNGNQINPRHQVYDY